MNEELTPDEFAARYLAELIKQTNKFRPRVIFEKGKLEVAYERDNQPEALPAVIL